MTYLGYAVGETLLVAIGILLAIQVDNWNERRQRRTELEDNLRYIQGDLEADNYESEVYRKALMQHVGYYNAILQGTARGSLMDSALRKMEFTYAHRPYHGGFKDMLTFGRLKEIQNAKLRRALRGYYEFTYAYLDREAAWHLKFLQDQVEDYSIRNFPLDEHRLVDREFVQAALDTGRLRSLMNFQKSSFDQIIRMMEMKITYANRIDSLIEVELEID